MGLLKQKGFESSGKKEEMIELLYGATAEEAAITSRKNELKAMEKDDLIKTLKARGLETSASKDKMVAVVLAYEANISHELKNYKVKVIEASKVKEESLAKKTGAVLKDMCAAKNVAVGGSNEDKIKRLVKVAQSDGELDELISKLGREARTKVLQSMDKLELVKLATSMGVDALVKEVMVERTLSHESEFGEPVTKKARR